MSSRFDRHVAKLAAAGALALALSLAACGLKGPLDPPPAATPSQAQVDATPSAPPPEGDTQQPQARRKSIFLDWLLN